MIAPKRIQRKRTKGWRMPDGAVYVGRPTRWGNPWRVGTPQPGALPGDRPRFARPVPPITPFIAVDLYRRSFFAGQLPVGNDALAELRGRDLVCWCPLDHPCHADVLLSVANS